MTLEPALMIQRFANGDAVEPRFQRAALAEIANAAKGFQENFLGAVGGIGTVAKHAEDEVIDRRMVVRNEPVEGRLRASLQLMDEFGFIAAPRKGTSPIGHCMPFRLDGYPCILFYGDRKYGRHRMRGKRATLLIGAA